jgi:hypothetical protein
VLIKIEAIKIVMSLGGVGNGFESLEGVRGEVE